MTIEVTEADIAEANQLCRVEGRPARGCCPIACAANRTLGTNSAQAGRDVLIAKGKAYILPPEAVSFTRRYDLKEPVRPFSFEIVAAPSEER